MSHLRHRWRAGPGAVLGHHSVNVDPMGDAGGDAAIWRVLRQAGLGDSVQSLEVGHEQVTVIVCVQ